MIRERTKSLGNGSAADQRNDQAANVFAPATILEVAYHPVGGNGHRDDTSPNGSRTTAQQGGVREKLAAVSPVAVPILATAAWLHSLQQVPLREMSELGLLSVMPWTFYLSLGLLALSTLDLLNRRRLGTYALVAHLALFVVILQGTPAVLYEAPRYSWTWKHLGIIDYITRTGGVNPDIASLGVYHNWPGFFAGAALLIEMTGLADGLAIARWAPLFFGLLNLGAVILLLSSLTQHSRVVWLGAWFFVLGNWVGQEYFSPQAATIFLFWVLLAMVIQALPTGRAQGRPWPLFGAGLTEKRQRMTLAIVMLAMIAVTASSHQLTPVMAVMVLGLLALSRQSRSAWLTLAALATTLGWWIYGANDFMQENIKAAIESLGIPVDNARASLIDLTEVSTGQAVVSIMSRGLTALMVAAAAVGVVRLWRAGNRNSAAFILLLSPAVLAGVTSYDGEILFRIYLFAIPALSLFAAHALLPNGNRALTWPTRALAAILSLALLTALLFAALGKERQNYMSPEEVAASRFVYENAPPGTLLIEGSRNYPGQFLNYEKFVYVPISLEPADTHRRLMANPVTVLEEWMSDDRYPATYLIITRSQKAEQAELRETPAGLLERIESRLRKSPQFVAVFSNNNAVVFQRRTSGGTEVQS